MVTLDTLLWWQLLVWIYFANTILLLIHEIESAYWKEWNLFGISRANEQKGLAIFLLLHLPLLALILWGLLEIFASTFTGLILSLLVAAAGIAAFTIHTVYLKKGNKEFKTTLSITLLVIILIVSAAQLILSIKLLL
jgi:hypothetical protein